MSGQGSRLGAFVGGRHTECACYVAVFALLLAAAAFAGYQQVFSTFAPYDDEGYVMLSVAEYLRGLPLYEEVYTQYGPALFAVEGGFHLVTGLPITHDVVRLRTLVLWLATALLAAGVTWRLSRSRPIALAAFAFAFLHLEKFCLEPGHPQELCAAAVLAATWLATYWPETGQRGWVPVGLGVVIGLALMTKLNIGVFLLGGIALAIAICRPGNRTWSIARMAIVAGLFLVPLAITWEHLGALAGWRLPVAVTAGIAAIVIAGRGAKANEAAPPGLGWFVLGVAVTCAALCGAVLSRGASLANLWYGMVGQHRGLTGPFYYPAPLPNAALMMGVFGVGAAWWMRNRREASLQQERGVSADLAFRTFAVMMAAAVLWRCIAETSVPLVHGLNDRGGARLLVTFATPLAWIVLFSSRDSAASNHFGRLALAAVAALQPLGAYPVPGTQMAVGALPLLVVSLVVLGDVLPKTLLSPQPQARRFAQGGLPFAAALLMALGATLLYRGLSLAEYRASLTPLALPGAARLRVRPETAEEQQWLVRELRENAQTFVFGEHAHNSLYFWTGLKPPTALNATVWPYLLRPDQQRRIVAALQESRVLLIREEYKAARPAGELPLADYLRENFSPHARNGRWSLWAKDPPAQSAEGSGRI